jgi:hypothetical protein
MPSKVCNSKTSLLTWTWKAKIFIMNKSLRMLNQSQIQRITLLKSLYSRLLRLPQTNSNIKVWGNRPLQIRMPLLMIPMLSYQEAVVIIWLLQARLTTPWCLCSRKDIRAHYQLSLTILWVKLPSKVVEINIYPNSTMRALWLWVWCLNPWRTKCIKHIWSQPTTTITGNKIYNSTIACTTLTTLLRRITFLNAFPRLWSIRPHHQPLLPPWNQLV